MFKKFRILLFCAVMTITGTNMTNHAQAQSLSDILGGLAGAASGNSNGSSGYSGTGSTIGNLLEGVFSSSKLDVSDLAGQWVSTGPAVCFQSDNFLQKAGGVAAAAVVESKLDPYYKQYGLNGAKFDIANDGSFTMTVKGIPLKGVITKDQGAADGLFTCTFTALGSMKLGSFKTYVTKSYNSMDIMFDATKLMSLISGIAKLTGNTLATTASQLLESYDGLCVGFKMNSTGSSTSGSKGSYGNSTKGNSGSSSNGNSSKGNSNNEGSDPISSGIEGLFNILGGSGKK